jgi:hypothetical protein
MYAQEALTAPATACLACLAAASPRLRPLPITPIAWFTSLSSLLSVCSPPITARPSCSARCSARPATDCCAASLSKHGRSGGAIGCVSWAGRPACVR